MRDQATELRKLVMRSMQRDAASAGDSPRLVVMAGGRSGVGTTTLAVNASVAMALDGSRVVLVDADVDRASVAKMCGLSEPTVVSDVLTARHDIHEVIQLGPAGIQIVPQLWQKGKVAELNESRLDRLVKQLRSLRRHADIVVIDAGSGTGPVSQRLWQTADEIVLTTTGDADVVMESYAAIKVLGAESDAAVSVVVNRADDGEAPDVFERIASSCQRFLNRHVTSLGHVVDDAVVEEAHRASCPLIFHGADAKASQCIQTIAVTLTNGPNETQIEKAA